MVESPEAKYIYNKIYKWWAPLVDIQVQQWKIVTQTFY